MSKTATFEAKPWVASSEGEAPAQAIAIDVTQEHVDNGYWVQFRDPVSLAIKEKLGECACAEVFWNSDSFGPRYASDDARIGIHVEILNDYGRCIGERHYWMPLPRKATRAMWKLRSEGIETFEPFTMQLNLPADAVATPA